MSDRRLTPFSGRVAHVSLRGRTDAPLTTGEAAAIAVPLAPLLAQPGGPLDRQLLTGAAVTVIDRDRGHAFVQAARDGYCGWVATGALGPTLTPTHRVCSPATHLYPAPRVQAAPALPLYLNAALQVTGVEGRWAETPAGHVPLSHLAPLNQPAPDPVAVAEALLGAPYLWGGNSVAGVDCSGLVQLAYHAAGRDCPGDSDLQQSMGMALADDAPLQRGDLIFWRGHVAILTAPDRLIHANGHSMSVAFESLPGAIARIEAQGGGPVTARRRPLVH